MGILRSVIAEEDLLPYSGEDGALELAFWGGWWLVWRDCWSCFDSRSGGFGGLPRFAPVGQSLFCSFLFTSLGSGHCPVAGFGVGVRLVVLWARGRTADLPVVSAPSSYFLD